MGCRSKKGISEEEEGHDLLMENKGFYGLRGQRILLFPVGDRVESGGSQREEKVNVFNVADNVER